MTTTPLHPFNRRNVLAAAGALVTAATLGGLARAASAQTAERSIQKGVLEVPGARLHYESLGSGSPLLLIPGGNGTAHIFGPISQILAARFTVITFDRRGFARSGLVGAQDYGRRLQTDADDALQLIKRVAGAPAAVFGPSSGAIVALQAMAQEPGSISKLVAYEPPVMKQLGAEGQTILQRFGEQYDLYKKSGPIPALEQFNTIFPPETVEHLARMRDTSNPASRAAVEYWFEHELRQYTAADLDIETLKTNAGRIVVAAGEGSRGYPLYPTAANLAKTIGASFVELPGAHTGYAVRSAEFGPALLNILGAGKER